MAKERKKTKKIEKPTKTEKTVEVQETVIETQVEDTVINSTETVIEDTVINSTETVIEDTITDINEQSAPINEEEKPSATETPIKPRHTKFSFGVSDGWYN